MIDPNFFTQWRSTAETVLSVLCAEEDVNNSRARFDMAAYDIGLTEVSFPPKYQIALWRTISALRKDNKAVSRSTIEGHPYGGANIPSEWLSLVMTQYSPLLDGVDGKVFRANAEALKLFGERYLLLQALEFAKADLETNKGVDDVVSRLMGIFTNRASGTIEGETADSQGFFDLFNLPPEPRTKSLITPIDIWTGGGLGLGEVVGIVAPEKARKTSLALNWVRNYAKQDASTAVFMLESTVDSIKARFVSMYAIEWLIERGLYNTLDNHKYPMYSGLSGRNILKARSGYKRWHPHKVQAIEAGMAQFSRLQKVVRFYDRSYLTGNLGNIQSIERVLNYDKRRYGTQMVMIDHLQRITGRSNIFELMSGAVNTLEDHVRKHQTTMILLSQLNESTKSIGSEATIVGSKGDGGALGAAVDYLFKLTHEYDAEAHISNITLNLFLSREGVGGKDVREVVKTEPVSGLIFDESTPQRQNLF